MSFYKVIKMFLVFFHPFLHAQCFINPGLLKGVCLTCPHVGIPQPALLQVIKQRGTHLRELSYFKLSSVLNREYSNRRSTKISKSFLPSASCLFGTASSPSPQPLYYCYLGLPRYLSSRNLFQENYGSALGQACLFLLNYHNQIRTKEDKI